MIRLPNKRYGPIGVDLGTRAIRLLQLSGDRSRVVEAARWELPAGIEDSDEQTRGAAMSDAIKQVCANRDFRGRDAVLCLGNRELFVQNIRVPKTQGDLTPVVQQEAAARIPYSIVDAEIRYLEAADIRQGDITRREIILLACHRPELQRCLDVITHAGLRPVAVDVEPLAMLRCYERQYRRDEDRNARNMFVHVGASTTVVLIAQGKDVLFVKYLDIGGNQFDEAVSRHLGMDLEAASLLRRHNGDRRADQRDAEVSRGVTQALRPVVDRLAHELAMCIRYQSVTFRGQPLSRTVIGGAEASPLLIEQLTSRHDIDCELGDPLRNLRSEVEAGRLGQWDIAAGLALREIS